MIWIFLILGDRAASLNPRVVPLAMLGGPVEKMSFFQIAPMTKVSTQIHSSMCQYDVYKVSSKKNEWKGSIGGVKVYFFFREGVEWAWF